MLFETKGISLFAYIFQSEQQSYLNLCSLVDVRPKEKGLRAFLTFSRSDSSRRGYSVVATTFVAHPLLPFTAAAAVYVKRP